jgi:hypothetical protein
VASNDDATLRDAETSSCRRIPETTGRYNGVMGDRALLEWLLYATVGLCALIAHNVFTALR